jgi:predicted ATPase/DNA-binding XRE family transcriptional regulator
MRFDGTFAEWLKRRRKALDLTQAELAEQVGCAVVTIRKIENGDSRPSKQIAGRLGEALALDASDLPGFVTFARGVTGVEADSEPALTSHTSYPSDNWPRPLTPFIGRRAELAQIAARLADPECRMLTLVGAGGVGKTRLAIEAAAHVVDFGGRVYFVSLAPITAVNWLPSAMATALQLTFFGAAPPHEQLLTYLRGKRLLLVLDNFEHLLDGSALLTEMLQVAPELKLLVTSRERLNLQAEWTLDLSGLSYRMGGVGDSSDDAPVLFAQSARRIQPMFTLEANAEAVATICEAVEGLPLGLELAATWLRVMPCGEIAERIRGDLDFLQAPPRHLSGRHSSLRAVFDQSWSLLVDAERDVLAKLSVFTGNFDLRAAEAVAGATPTILARLIDKSMVTVGTTARYSLHERLRQYAAERLRVANATNSMQSAPAHYYADFMFAREKILLGFGQLRAMREIAIEWINVRMAAEWAIAGRNFEVMNRLIGGLYYYGLEFRIVDARHIWERALIVFAPRADEAAHPVWGRLLSRAVFILGVKGSGEELRSEAMRRGVEKSLDIARQFNDKAEITFSLWANGLLWVNLDGGDRAFLFFEESLAFAHEVNDLFAIAYCTHWVAAWYRRVGKLDQYMPNLMQAITYYQTLGNDYEIAWIKFSLGAYHLRMGHAQESERYLRESRVVHQRFGSPYALARCDGELALLSLMRGDLTEANAHTESVLALAAEQNFSSTRAFGLRTVIAKYCLEARYDEAAALADEMMMLDKSLQHTYITSWLLAMIAWGLGEVEHTRRNLYERGFPSEEVRSLPLFRMLTLPIGALLLAHDGEYVRATQALSLAVLQPSGVSGWIAVWPPLIELRTELIARLGETAFNAAWESGAALTFEQALPRAFALLQSRTEIADLSYR